jgi:phage anti-repressor protein
MSLVLKKCSKNWLKEALAVIQPTDGRQMLTLKEFVTATDFAVDKWSMDKFFHNIKDEVPIYMDQPTIEWFGYGGLYKVQKDQITKLLKNNFAEYENKLWFEYSNKDYVKFYEENPMTSTNVIENKSNDISENAEKDENAEENTDSEEIVGPAYPNPTDFKGKNKTKHMVVHPTVFKHIVLMAKTKKASEIRDYYITIEELIKKYSHYQVEQLRVSNFSLVYKLDQMRIEAAEERKLQDIRFNKLFGASEKMDSKLDKVMTNYVELDNLPVGDAPQVIIMRDKDAEPGESNLYVIRCQSRDLNARIKKLRSDYGENIKRSYTIQQPNAIAFWKLIKKKNDKHIIRAAGSNWFRLTGITQRNFYDLINRADVDRKKKV